MDDRTFDRRQDEPLPPIPERASGGPDPLLSRRRLLGGAGCSFVLAASGLLVPEGVEAERQRPLERIQNDPRERNRKDRNDKNRNDKNRNRKDRNDNGLGGCRGFCKDVELNYFSGPKTTSPTYRIDVWVKKSCTSEGPHNVPECYREFSSNHAVPPVRRQEKFTGSDDFMAMTVWGAVPSGVMIFQVENHSAGAPTLKVYEGYFQAWGPTNVGTVYFNHGVDEGQRVTVPGFYVDRGTDSAKHKIFSINAAD